MKTLGKLHCWLTFSLSLTLVCSARSAPTEGVYFIDIGERFPTYSSWMITFSYDMSPYKQHIGELKSEMDSFYSMIKNLQINTERVADKE